MNLRAQSFYEPETQKKLNTRHQKKKEPRSGPKISLNLRKFYEHNTKCLMNLRPPKRYEPKGPKPLWTQDAKKYDSKGTRCLPANRQKNVNTRPQKFYEPKANRAACSANVSGGGAAPSPPTPLPAVFFKDYLLCRDSPPPPETSPPPIETIL